MKLVNRKPFPAPNVTCSLGNRTRTFRSPVRQSTTAPSAHFRSRSPKRVNTNVFRRTRLVLVLLPRRPFACINQPLSCRTCPGSLGRIRREIRALYSPAGPMETRNRPSPGIRLVVVVVVEMLIQRIFYTNFVTSVRINSWWVKKLAMSCMKQELVFTFLLLKLQLEL